MYLPRGQGIKVLYLLALAFFAIRAGCTPLGSCRGLVVTGETIFDVTKYGAIGDGKTESSTAFIKAWNAACNSVGPVRLLIPDGTFLAGEMMLKGPCSALKPINIEIQGTILGSTNLSLFKGDRWITIEDIDGVILNGGGTLNGQGEASWKSRKPGKLLPDGLVLENVTNAIMQNINFVNSKGYHMKVLASTNITISDLNITAPDESPNTDGIHVGRSQCITITNSVIGTGDDCISIGDGNDNVNISKIFCGPGHGISIGSLGKRQGETDVKGIFVTNCTLSCTTNGARIKTWRDSPVLQASNIVYEDIVMNEVKNPIVIDQNYHSSDRVKPSEVKITDVHFKNIKGTTISEVPVDINCSEAIPCEGIELANIDLVATSKDVGPLSSSCTNAKVQVYGKLNPPGCS